MLSHRWERIIDAISYVNPECIDSEKLKRVLYYDTEVDAQVLDNLYILGVLTLDDYKGRMSKYIQHMKLSIDYAEKRIETANEQGKKFDPMIFYCCTTGYRGAAIQDGANFDFMDRFNVKK